MMYVDASRFHKKMYLIRKNLPAIAAKEVTSIAQMVFDKTKANLKGASVGVRQSKSGLQYPKTPPQHPLKMPVRRVTGNLARSLTMKPISTMEYIIYCDPQIAKYAKYIHSGTRHIKPRRFLGDVISGNKYQAVQRLDSVLKQMMRTV